VSATADSTFTVRRLGPDTYILETGGEISLLNRETLLVLLRAKIEGGNHVSLGTDTMG
jgi:hypothetical protein